MPRMLGDVWTRLGFHPEVVEAHLSRSGKDCSHELDAAAPVLSAAVVDWAEGHSTSHSPLAAIVAGHCIGVGGGFAAAVAEAEVLVIGIDLDCCPEVEGLSRSVSSALPLVGEDRYHSTVSEQQGMDFFLGPWLGL